MKQFHNVNRSSGMPVSMGGGEARSKRYILRHFLKVETEVDERTDSGKLFQIEWAQELNYLFPALVLTLGTDKVIPLFDLSERAGSGIASKVCRLTGVFFTKSFVRQQTDLEINSKFYWQPMKGA